MALSAGNVKWRPTVFINQAQGRSTFHQLLDNGKILLSASQHQRCPVSFFQAVDVRSSTDEKTHALQMPTLRRFVQGRFPVRVRVFQGHAVLRVQRFERSELTAPSCRQERRVAVLVGAHNQALRFHGVFGTETDLQAFTQLSRIGQDSTLHFPEESSH
jgi:hypothetical protein